MTFTDPPKGLRRAVRYLGSPAAVFAADCLPPHCNFHHSGRGSEVLILFNGEAALDHGLQGELVKSCLSAGLTRGWQCLSGPMFGHGVPPLVRRCCVIKLQDAQHRGD